MGSQAELLSKRIKRFGMDTIIIWLILSKVTYEFIHYFPYEIFNVINIPWFPWINELAILNDELINNMKNIAVLGFFILVLIIIGIYEIHKYHKERKKPLEERIDAEKELITPETSGYEPQPILEEERIREIDSADHDEENGINIEKSADDDVSN